MSNPADPKYMRERAADLIKHGQVETDYGPGVRAIEALAAEALEHAANALESRDAAIGVLEGEIVDLQNALTATRDCVTAARDRADSMEAVVEAARAFHGDFQTRHQWETLRNALTAYDQPSGDSK